MGKRIVEISVFHAKQIHSLIPVEVVGPGRPWDDPVSNNLIGHHLGYPEIHEVHGEVPEMTLLVLQSSMFIIKRVITERTQLWLGFDEDDDGEADSWEPWRVTSVDIAAAGHSPALIKAQPMWADMVTSTFRYVRADIYNSVSYRLPVRKIVFQDALDLIFDFDYGCPSNMRLGTIAAGLEDVIVTLDANASSHMELVANVCKAVAEYTGLTCEFNHRYTGGNPNSPSADLLIHWDFWVEAGWTEDEYLTGIPMPERRPIQEPGYGESNLLDLRIVDGDNDLFTMVIPFGGRDETTRVGIGGLEWDIDPVVGLTYFPLPQETKIVLVDPIIYFPDLYDGNFSIVTNDPVFKYFDILRVEEPNIIWVFGNVTQGTPTTIQILSSKGAGKTGGIGTEVTYVFDPVLEEKFGRVELPIDFPDIPPYENIYERETGDSGDMSGDGVPAGWTPGSGVTITQVTDAPYVSFGTRALKIEFTNVLDTAFSTGFALTPTQRSPQFSFWIAGRAEVGSVRVSLVDANGRGEPVGNEKAEFHNDELGAIGAGGLLPGAGSARLRFTALEAPSTLYVDAITITQSIGPWEYAREMGPKALYFAAVRYMKREGGITKQVRYDGDLFDPHVLDEDNNLFDEIVLGRWVRVQTFHEPDGVNADIPVINFDARITEITTTEDPNFGRLQKRVSFEIQRLNVTKRFTFETARWPLSRKPRPFRGIVKGPQPRELLMPLTPEELDGGASAGFDTPCLAVRGGHMFLGLFDFGSGNIVENRVIVEPSLPVRQGIDVARSITLTWGVDPDGWAELFVSSINVIDGALHSFVVDAVTKVNLESRMVYWKLFEIVDDEDEGCAFCWRRNSFHTGGEDSNCFPIADMDVDDWTDGAGSFTYYSWQGHYHEDTNAVYLISNDILTASPGLKTIRAVKYDPPVFSSGSGNTFTRLASLQETDDLFGEFSFEVSFTHRTVLLGDYIYLFGIGAVSGSPFAEWNLFRYSIYDDEWVQMTNVNPIQGTAARLNGVAWTDGTDLYYVGGGRYNSIGTPHAELYKVTISGTTATWSDTGMNAPETLNNHIGLYDPDTGLAYIIENDTLWSFNGSTWTEERTDLESYISPWHVPVSVYGDSGSFYVLRSISSAKLLYINADAASPLENTLPDFPSGDGFRYAAMVNVPDLDENGFGPILFIFGNFDNGPENFGYAPLYRTFNPFTGDVSP